MVLIHSRGLEEEFVREGYGAQRITIMYNEFVVVGPSDDPALVRGDNLTLVLDTITSAGEKGLAVFISKGDNSGTHLKELEVCDMLGSEPREMNWYLEAAIGMGSTLRMAYQKRAYALINSGTWRTLSPGDSLEIVARGDPSVTNPYSTILVSTEIHPRVNREAAIEFIRFLTSDKGQSLIQSVTVKGGAPFKPAFGITEKLRPPSREGVVLS